MTSSPDNRPKRFALIGAAGYIAPRHLQAIKDTGNVLVAACDPHDSVGILDRYFHRARFFQEFERFDRHVEKLRRMGEGIDYVTICSPNYLHDAHVRFALRIGAHAVCEKPLVANTWNIDPLVEIAAEQGKNIYPILQLREHPTIVDLRERMLASPTEMHEIDLTYLTSRGPWYLSSWKGRVEHSGGLATNIGIHFFDMLMWVFGGVTKNEVHLNTPASVAGSLQLERARVRWFLSIDRDNLPESAKRAGQTTYRSIEVDGEEVEFSSGFTDLHTVCYQRILEDKSWGPEDARPAVELARQIRHAEPVGVGPDSHPFLGGKKGGNDD